MSMSVNRELEQETKDRIADRYTAAELCDLLDIPVEDLVEEYWELILRKASLFEDVFSEAGEEEEDE